MTRQTAGQVQLASPPGQDGREDNGDKTTAPYAGIRVSLDTGWVRPVGSHQSTDTDEGPALSVAVADRAWRVREPRVTQRSSCTCCATAAAPA